MLHLCGIASRSVLGVLRTIKKTLYFFKHIVTRVITGAFLNHVCRRVNTPFLLTYTYGT